MAKTWKEAKLKGRKNRLFAKANCETFGHYREFVREGEDGSWIHQCKRCGDEFVGKGCCDLNIKHLLELTLQ